MLQTTLLMYHCGKHANKEWGETCLDQQFYTSLSVATEMINRDLSENGLNS